MTQRTCSLYVAKANASADVLIPPTLDAAGGGESIGRKMASVLQRVRPRSEHNYQPPATVRRAWLDSNMIDNRLNAQLAKNYRRRSVNMAHSFITYKTQDVRVNDFDLIVLIFFLEKTAREIRADSELKELFLMWIDSVKNDGAGNINLHLDLLLKNPDYAAWLDKTVQEAKKSLSSLPEIIPASCLEKLVRIGGIAFGDYQKIFLQSVLVSFEDVIRGD